MGRPDLTFAPGLGKACAESVQILPARTANGRSSAIGYQRQLELLAEKGVSNCERGDGMMAAA